MMERRNPEESDSKSVASERSGAALIVALIVLLLFTLAGSAIMILSVNEDRMVHGKMDSIGALAYAEAGVAEAIRRLSLQYFDSLYIGDPHHPFNADWAVYLLFTKNLPQDEPPVYYRQSVQMDLPERKRLSYSSKILDGGRSLTVHHKCSPNDTGKIYYYNWEIGSEELHDAGTYSGMFFPIEVIEVTGVSGKIQRTLRVEVARTPVPVNVISLLSCNGDIELQGKMVLCGHNHLFSTPWGTDAGENRFDCFDDPDTMNDTYWHVPRNDGKAHAGKDDTYTRDEMDRQCSKAGCIPGVAAHGHQIKVHDRSLVRGNPDRRTDTTGTDFYNLYQMLDTSSGEELEQQYQWQNIEPGTINGGSFIGFYRCEGNLKFKGIVNFTGVLWVTGSIRQSGHFFARGIVYSADDMRFDGNVWILGAIATKGGAKTRVQPFNGSGVLLYSSGGIQRAIAEAKGYRIISRKEQ